MPNNRILPDKPLQLTAGDVVLLLFLGLRRVLAYRACFGKLRPQLNL